MKELVWWFFVIVVLKESAPQPLEPCERSRRGAAREGNLGSTHAFPWLGVLRVHLHQESSLQIALTGIVLVKERYAIGNADDIVKIPKRVFLEDTRAMFIPAERAPWFCRPLDFITHPDYDLETLNTMALIELEPPPGTNFPMKPVCQPMFGYNITNNLYAVGYTDENQILEKVIHKIQYVDQDLCKQFYSRAGLNEGMMAPLNVECGFAHNNRESCAWDNGRALVSNTSGYWVLIGFGVQGPGCSAPARFLAVSRYSAWIESAANVEEIEDEVSYRKSAFNIGFKKSSNLVHYIPAHELLSSNSSAARRDQPEHEKHLFAHHYSMGLGDEDPFQVKRISGTEIQISGTNKAGEKVGSFGDCSDGSIRLIYKDFIDINKSSPPFHAPELGSSVEYLVTLHDSLFLNYTCVTIKLQAKDAMPAYLHYDTKLADSSMFPETPDEIIRVYPLHTFSTLVEKDKKSHLLPAPIKSKGTNISGYNINLYLKASFSEKCRIEVRMYGPPGDYAPPRTTTVEPTTTTVVPTTTTTDPYADLKKNVPLEISEPEIDRNVSFKEEAVYNSVDNIKNSQIFQLSVLYLVKSYL